VCWHDSEGNEPNEVKNGICLHEEDGGILWKHTDWRDKSMDLRRNRKLILSCFCTVANYDYGFYWTFTLDGTIQFDVKMTGFVNTTAWDYKNKSITDVNPYRTTLNPVGLDSPIHQHIFCMRLDMGVDGFGSPNTVVEVDVETHLLGTGSPQNTQGNAFYAVEKAIKRESEGARDVNPLRDRFWKIYNTEQKNKVRTNTCYKLMPITNTMVRAWKDSPVMNRAGFMGHQLWVTKHSDEEKYPAGMYPNQHPGGRRGWRGGEGLPEFIEADRELIGTDVVVWYVLGACHIPRLEDLPVMPVSSVAFSLVPDGFFDENPSLDLPIPLCPKQTKARKKDYQSKL